MITVANLGTIQEAEALKFRLAAAGIEAFIPDEVSAGIAPFLFMNRPGIRLQVAEDDEAVARQLIENDFEMDDLPPGDQPE